MSESTEPITWASIKEMYKKLSTAPYAPDMYIVRPEQYEQAVQMFGVDRVVQSSHIPDGTMYGYTKPKF